MAGAITKAKAAFSTASASMPITFSVSAASMAAVLKDAKGAFRSASATMPLQFSVTQAAVTAGAVAARAAFKASGQAVTMPIQFTTSAAAVAAGSVAARTAFRASGQSVTMPINFTVSTASFAAAAAAAKTLSVATNTASGSATTFRGRWGLLGTVLTASVPLFGAIRGPIVAGDDALTQFRKTVNDTLPNILTSVAGWHLLVDGVGEFLAVVLPASIALGAFGIGAAPVIADMVTGLKNVDTVAQATGQTLGYMNGAVNGAVGGYQRLQNELKAGIYQQFGDVMTIVGDKTGVFNKLALQTGGVLQQFGARFAVAMGNAGAFDKVLSGGPEDLQKIGDSLANLTSVLGSFIKAVPGYASILLTLFDQLTKGAAIVANFAVPLLHAGLALHGFFLYTGLAVTAVLALAGPLTAAAGWLITTAVAVNALGVSMDLAAADGDLFGAAMLFINATGGPIVWIAAAVAALGVLVYLMVSAKTATQQWTGSLQKLVTAAPVVDALTTIIGAQVQVTTRLQTANNQLATIQETAVTRNNRMGTAVSGVTAAYTKQSTAVSQLTSASVQLSDEASLFNYRLTDLGKTYGGTAAASGLLNAAGVTTAQMLNMNGEAWAIIQQQVKATVLAYKDMGTTSGALGNDLAVLNEQTTDGYKAMQNLNTALSTFIGDVTGTQTSFDTVALGGITLAANFKTASAAAQTTKHTLDGLTVSSTLAGAAMDGTSQASLTLNQAFATQVGNINTLAASYRTAGIAGNLQKDAIADSIAPMEKYAAGSQEATAQLGALAEEAGYNGPISMAAMNKWLGITSTSTGALAADQKNLKSITNQATVQEALLTASMQGQGNYIANTLLKDLSDAELKYSGVVAATTAWGKAIAQNGAASTQAQSARTALINDLIASGKAAGDTTTQIAAMITKITGIPASKAFSIVMTGEGKYAISATGGLGGGQKTAAGGSAALGMLVTGGIPGKDSVLVNTMPGELIVPTPLVNAGAVDHLRGRIPGFAAGGVVPGVSGAGNLNVLTGQQAVTDYSSFKMSMQNAMVSAMRTAILAAAKAAASISGVAGPGGGAPAANAALAQKMMPAWASGAEWAAWNAVAMMESGWSSTIANPTSSARGIAQNINGWGPGYIEGNAASQISWMIQYIQQRYIDPIGALAHENAYHWYGAGTQGAEPGWGVVGERGAELVKFHGGETVMPHAASMAALGLPGYASGTGSWQSGRSDFQRWPKETYPANVAATATLLAQQKAVIAAGGLPAADLRKIRAGLVSTEARSAFLKTEGKDVTAYQVHLRAYTKLLADQVVATRSVGLKAESAALAKTLAGATATLAKVSAWLTGPVKAAAPAAAAAATAAAGTTTAATGPSGQDLITAWLTAQGWIVGGSPVTATSQPMQWFDTGGRLPTGVSMVGNQTGGSERILSHGEEDALSRLAGGGGSKVEALLGQVVRLLGDAPGKTAAGVGDAINGAARGAVRRGQYTTR